MRFERVDADDMVSLVLHSGIPGHKRQRPVLSGVSRGLVNGACPSEIRAFPRVFSWAEKT